MDSTETSCFAICPTCESEKEHEIVRKREVGSGLDVKIRCNDCSIVHKIHIRPNKGIKLAKEKTGEYPRTLKQALYFLDYLDE